MKEKVLEKEENEEYTFPSGKSEDDFDQWMLTRIFNWDKYYGPSGGAGDSNIKKTLTTYIVNAGRSGVSMCNKRFLGDSRNAKNVKNTKMHYRDFLQKKLHYNAFMQKM